MHTTPPHKAPQKDTATLTEDLGAAEESSAAAARPRHGYDEEKAAAVANKDQKQDGQKCAEDSVASSGLRDLVVAVETEVALLDRVVQKLMGLLSISA